MTRFAERFKIESSRLENWDYSTPGIYFITVGAVYHNKFFGKIVEGRMVLSKMGNIVKEELLKTFEIRKNIKLHEYVIMPNHVHLLMEIKYRIEDDNVGALGKKGGTLEKDVETCRRRVSTVNRKVLENIHKTTIAISYWKPNSIGSIMNQFKSSVTRRINPKTIFFGWQPRFYDEIIKDEDRLKIVKHYINNNPKNWEKDRFYK